MSTMQQPVLVNLDDTDLTIADPSEDIRGYKVSARDGDDIGKVEGLMIDGNDRKVRFLEVGAGGFLGIGERKFLIPVDAISRVEDDQVYVDRDRQHIIDSPAYDPAIAQKPDFWESTYGYYGYVPYWGSGYAYPGLGATLATSRGVA